MAEALFADHYKPNVKRKVFITLSDSTPEKESEAKRQALEPPSFDSQEWNDAFEPGQNDGATGEAEELARAELADHDAPLKKALDESLKDNDAELTDQDGTTDSDRLRDLIKAALANDKVTVQVQALKAEGAPPAMILLPEQMRRLNDMGALLEQRLFGKSIVAIQYENTRLRLSLFEIAGH